MQVTLNLDSARMGDTIEQVFGQLTPEDRRAVAFETMKAFLAEPHSLQRGAQEAVVLADLRRRNPRVWSGGRGTVDAATLTDKELRETSEFCEAMKRWRSVQEQMVEQIVESALKEFKARVDRLVAEDLKVQIVLEQVMQGLTGVFPKAVHDACVAWMCGHMSEVAQRAFSAATLNTDQELKDLRARLASVPTY
jgi:hypothetical protein